MSETHDDQTMTKVYAALRGVGLMNAEIELAINAMQSAGILFRERGEDDEYEYRLRADLPEGFDQPTSRYATFEEAVAARDRIRSRADKVNPATTLSLKAFRALSNGWIERHRVNDWERIDEQ